MRTDARPLYRQRWLIISNALVQPRKAEEIARHCGVSKARVHQVISTYNRLGVVAVETAGKGGRRHQYLTREEEEQFLAPFLARAQAGEIATVREITNAGMLFFGVRSPTIHHPGRSGVCPISRDDWCQPLR